MKPGINAWSRRLVNTHCPSLMSRNDISSAFTWDVFISLSRPIMWHLWLNYANGQRHFFTRMIGRRFHLSCTIRWRLCSHPHNFRHLRPLSTIIHVPVGPRISTDPPFKESPLGQHISPVFLPCSHLYARLKRAFLYSYLGLINLFHLHAIALQLNWPWEGGAKGVISCVKGVLTS